MKLIEQKIVQLLKEGDRKAISLLYDHYADTLYGVILNILKDEAHAKDALQESFIKYWKKGASYQPEKGKLFTWLLQIARNTAIDKYRSINNRGNKEIQIVNFNVDNERSSSFKPELMDLADHVANMELKYREVIEALFFGGMTQKEASKTLKLPLGTVKTRLKKGLSNLRSIFGEREFTIMILISLLS